MSSPTKDARWQLAHDMLQNTQFAENLALMPYPVQEHILRSAQSVLELMTQPEIAELAKMFNAGRPSVTKLPRTFVDMKRLEDLQRLNASGDNGTYLLDPVELDEILDLAMDGLDAREGAERVTEKKVLKILARLIKEQL